MNHANGFGSIYIWNAADGQSHQLTDEMFDAGNPAWDPKGDYLYFLSNHEFAPQISTHRVQLRAQPVHRNLRAGASQGREASVPAGERRSHHHQRRRRRRIKTLPRTRTRTRIKKAKEKEAKKELTIDFDGLGSRVARVPVEASNYRGLEVKDGHLLYVTAPAFYYGREAATKPALKIYSIKDRKETVLAEDANGFWMSRDGSKVLVRQQQPNQPAAWLVMDATPTGAASKKTVSTAGLMVDRVPAEEWPQIFNEVWRRYRDFFYVPNMHGYDWEALREQYRRGCSTWAIARISTT